MQLQARNLFKEKEGWMCDEAMMLVVRWRTTKLNDSDSCMDCFRKVWNGSRAQTCHTNSPAKVTNVKILVLRSLRFYKIQKLLENLLNSSKIQGLKKLFDKVKAVSPISYILTSLAPNYNLMYMGIKQINRSRTY